MLANLGARVPAALGLIMIYLAVGSGADLSQPPAHKKHQGAQSLSSRAPTYGADPGHGPPPDRPTGARSGRTRRPVELLKQMWPKTVGSIAAMVGVEPPVEGCCCVLACPSPAFSWGASGRLRCERSGTHGDRADRPQTRAALTAARCLPVCQSSRLPF
ncbi:hypothetical protein GCM10009735_86150 [Actinomadura chokoriensis]